MTNRKYCKENAIFKEACSLATVDPTRRQASKFRLGKGRAIHCLNEAKEIVNKPKEVENGTG